MSKVKSKLESAINQVVAASHEASTQAGWWDGVDINDPYVVACKLMLTVSELSEAMEGDRKNLMDDKLPHRKMIEVELGDALLRICDLAGELELNLGGAVVEKMEFNAIREDHKIENRQGAHGKKY